MKSLHKIILFALLPLMGACSGMLDIEPHSAVSPTVVGSDDIEALRAGVGLIAQKFHEVLRSCGVSEIEAKGLELDTDHHEAVARFDAGKEKKGKIVDVVQPGYKMGDKVLRFAKVVVGE